MVMAEVLDEQLSIAINKQKQILSDHLEFWNKVSEQVKKKSEADKIARKSIFQTGRALESIEELSKLASAGGIQLKATSGTKRASEEPEAPVERPKKKSKKEKANENGSQAHTNGQADGSVDYEAPVIDHTGLFAIDTNPTPVNLDTTSNWKKGRDNAKRRRSTDQGAVSEGQVPQQEDLSATHEPQPTKKSKKQHKNDPTEDEVQEASNLDEEMEQKVALRMKQADDVKASEVDKKRKRSSSVASDESLPNVYKGDSKTRFQHPYLLPDLKHHLEPALTPKQVRKKALQAKLVEAQAQGRNITMKEIKKENSKKGSKRAKEQQALEKQRLANEVQVEGEEAVEATSQPEKATTQKPKKKKAKRA